MLERKILIPQKLVFELQRSCEIEPWFVPHPFVICNNPVVKGEFSNQEINSLLGLSSLIFSYMADNFAKRGCPIIIIDEGEMTEITRKGENYQPPQESQLRATILHPVFLGEYPEKMKAVLKKLRSFGNQIDPNKPSEIRNRLRDAFLGIDFTNGERPYAFDPGVEITKKLNIDPAHRLKVGFANVIFQKDSFDLFNNLSSEWQKIILWMYMANFGAFRQIFIPFKIEDEGVNYSLILSTLEGGRPNLSLEELTRRIMALGSSIELGGFRELEGVNIPLETWQSLEPVNAIIDLGAFCGESKHKLLSDPIRFSDLVKNPKLAMLEERLAGYGGQAEGAFQSLAYLPKLAQSLNLPFDFIPFSTRSGQLGVVKTNLTFSDFSPVGGFLDENVALVIPIGNKVFGKPSVEAAELIETDIKLAQENPGSYTVRLRKEEDGFLLDPNGEITGPVVARKLHFHRGVRINNPQKFSFLPMDIVADPPSACGFDLQKKHTEKYTRLAAEEWERSGRRLLGVVIEMANHGCLVELFWSADDCRDPVLRFMEAVENSEIEFFLPVPQK